MEFLRSVSSSLRAIGIEAAEKIESAMQYADDPERNFLELCKKDFAPAQFQEINRTLAFARRLKSRDPHHPSMRAYFSHPVRVATLALRLMRRPSLETVMMGLTHNVFEVSGLQEQDLLNEGVNKRMADGVRLLTIDRSQQYDPEYLRVFYRNIEAFGNDLVLVRCVDRLDNLLGLQVVERSEALDKYLYLSEQFVVPLAAGLSAEFGAYLGEAIEYARATGCDQDLRVRYQTFLARSAGRRSIEVSR
jgi:(p)ppGpp synthase/HD superfamily hydrolase